MIYLFSLVLLISFFICLFYLYRLGKEDFVLIRKNISLEQLFNIAFIMYGFGLVMSRLVYVLLHPNKLFLNPIVFLDLLQYPGLSMLGGLIGAGICLYFIGKFKKAPSGRLLDFFALSTLYAMPFAYAGLLLLQKPEEMILTGMAIIFYFLLFIFFSNVLYPRMMRGAIKDGTVGLFFLINISVVSLVLSLLTHVKGNSFVLNGNDLLAILLFFSAFLLLFRLQLRPIRSKRN